MMEETQITKSPTIFNQHSIEINNSEVIEHQIQINESSNTKPDYYTSLTLPSSSNFFKNILSKWKKFSRKDKFAFAAISSFVFLLFLVSIIILGFISFNKPTSTNSIIIQPKINNVDQTLETFSLNIRILNTYDDAEEFTNGQVYLTSSDLEFTYDSYYKTSQIVGLRFTSVSIPAGSTILSASVQFIAKEANSQSANLVIKGQKSSNAQTFSTTASNLSTRTKTTSSVAWTLSNSWTAEQTINTADISTLIQEIIELPNWASGNSIALFISGTGSRTVYSLESGVAKVPRLIVQYSTPSNLIVVANAGSDKTITLPSTATLTGSYSPSTATVLWSKASGPGSVTFSSPNSISTTATFSIAGTYSIRLTVTSGSSVAVDTANVLVQEDPSTPPTTSEKIFFATLGDVGKQSSTTQLRGANALATKCATNTKCDFVVLLGDNHYSYGVTSVTDPKWNSDFVNVYTQSSVNVPFYAVLGNHDYLSPGKAQAQVDYTNVSPRWKMPSRYYFVDKVVGDVKARLVFLDTNVFKNSYQTSAYGDLTQQNPSAQLSWLRTTLSSTPTDYWKIVFAHQPIRSASYHGDTSELISQIQPILKTYGVKAYFSAHDHNLQYLQEEQLSMFVSGAGADLERSMNPHPNLVYSYISSQGVIAVTLTQNNLKAEFTNSAGSVIYVKNIPK